MHHMWSSTLYFTAWYRIVSSHLISPFESSLCCLAPWFHRLNKDAEASLAAPLHAEVERRLPGCLLQSDLSPLSLGCARYVQQPQMALHFLTRSEKWENDGPKQSRILINFCFLRCVMYIVHRKTNANVMLGAVFTREYEWCHNNSLVWATSLLREVSKKCEIKS